MSHKWLRAPHQLRLVFLAVTLLLASTVGYLGWHLLSQERDRFERQFEDQRNAAARLAVSALERSISAMEQELDEILAEGAAQRVPEFPSGAALFQFRVARRFEALNLFLFGPADALALEKDFAGANALLRDIADAGDLRVRAEALARIARNQLKAGQPDDSLRTYKSLAAFNEVTVNGLPAVLWAGLGSLNVLKQRKDPEAAVAAAVALNRELNSGRWALSFDDYETLSKATEEFRPDAQAARSRMAITEAVRHFWQEWLRDTGRMTSGRDSLPTQQGSVLLVWRALENKAAVFVADADWLKREWFSELDQPLEGLRTQVLLTDSRGNRVFGTEPQAGDSRAIQLERETNLPWTVQAFSTVDEKAEMNLRAWILAASMAVLLVLILTGAWFVGHAVSRELAVARLQSDFVSVVSHEFRTPLTALCQLSEMLQRGRLTSEEDRKQCYHFLHDESHRLRRLVESLLDFGRLESGKMQFHFERIDAAALLHETAQQFSKGQPSNGHRIELDTTNDLPIIRGDRETMRCVFWNLFENAVKYSPESDAIWVKLAKNGTHAEVSVRDKGVGIHRTEQHRVFEKFVRGSAARASNVRGTGIGLAVAREIVRAHGGDITVESEPGLGSTFFVRLPLESRNGNGDFA